MILHTDSTDNSKDPSAPDMDENGDLTEAADRALGSPAVRKMAGRSVPTSQTL
mgnify:CR=1 FL=1